MKSNIFPLGGTEHINNALIKLLTDHGFESSRFQNGKINVEGTLVSCVYDHHEWYNDYEGGVSCDEYRLSYKNVVIARSTERTDDLTQVYIENIIPGSLPEKLVLEPSRPVLITEQKEEPDYLAPDGSIITCLVKGQKGDLGDTCHCKLPVGKTSTAVKHQTVQEIWYFTAGHGEFWLEHEGVETLRQVKKGTSILIHPGVSFQFRNLSSDTHLESLITTMPPWPGPNEAVKVLGKWSPSTNVSLVSPSRNQDSLFGSSDPNNNADTFEDTLVLK